MCRRHATMGGAPGHRLGYEVARVDLLSAFTVRGILGPWRVWKPLRCVSGPFKVSFRRLQTRFAFAKALIGDFPNLFRVLFSHFFKRKTRFPKARAFLSHRTCESFENHR